MKSFVMTLLYNLGKCRDTLVLLTLPFICYACLLYTVYLIVMFIYNICLHML